MFSDIVVSSRKQQEERAGYVMSPPDAGSLSTTPSAEPISSAHSVSCSVFVIHAAGRDGLGMSQGELSQCSGTNSQRAVNIVCWRREFYMNTSLALGRFCLRYYMSTQSHSIVWYEHTSFGISEEMTVR